MNLHLSAVDRQAPLLLFDAADPGNLGWFSRCQFYVDGKTGAVLQTPMLLGKPEGQSGADTLPDSVRLQITKELPASFRMPGKRRSNRTNGLRGALQPAQRAAEHRRGRVWRIDCEAAGGAH